MLDQQTIALLNQLGFDAARIESLFSGVLLVSVLALIAAVPTAIIAKRKRRSRPLWLLFALTIPFLPLLLIYLLPALPAKEE